MGTLVVHFNRRASQRWTVGYEVSLGDRIVHFALAGGPSGALVDGSMTSEAAVSIRRVDLWTAIGLQPPESPPQSFNLPQLTVADLVPVNGSVELSVAATGQPTKEPESIEELYRLLDRDLPTTRYLGFAGVLSMILTEGLLLTDNLRSPLRTRYKLSELASPLSLSNGSCAPGELLRLKNGTSPERLRYERARELFNALTGHGFDVRLSVVSQSGADQFTEVEALPAVLERQGDIPLALAGAGFHEALLLATLLSSEDQVIVFDEPAVQLAVGAQRRVLTELRRRQESGGQLVLITHSPELVPAGSSSDLGSIVRLSRGSAGTEVHRLEDPADSNSVLQRRFGQLLRISDIRGLLFADGVLLTEGGTETGALDRWLGSSADDANVRLVPVDGDTAYGTYVELLDAFGIPWAILCDGPALRCGSAMHKQLSTHGRFQGLAAANTADFEAVKAWWKRGGVHTLASEFGDDGSKSGEFEVFLKALNADVFKRADKANQRSKVRTGMLFADRVECPDQVVELWSQVIQVLHQRPTQPADE
ncbi:MAG: ATP-dependent nuclease [Acidimicrobiales bacterium]